MTEEQIQNQCILWFDKEYPEHRKMLFHVDNNSWNKIIGARKKALGVQAGVSDLILICPGRCVFIEMKNEVGVQKPEQLIFEERLISRGHVYFIIRSLNEFKELIWQIIGR